MKLNAVSLLITILFMMNVVVGIGNYFNDELATDLYENLNITYGGNITGFNYTESDFESISDQLKDNPTATATGGTFENFKNLFNGVPELVYETMSTAKFPDSLSKTIYYGLTGVMAVIYIIFILQIISYLLGGGE